MVSQATTLSATEGEPRVSPVRSSVREALADPHWLRAIEEEYAALLANQTWDLVPRLSGCNVVTGKWTGRISVGLMAHWIATRLAGFSRASVQW